MSSVLAVSDLAISFARGAQRLEALRGVSFEIGPGECLGVVGESGSGKTQLFLAVMGLLAGNARASGRVAFQGTDLLGLPAGRMNQFRGAGLSMVFQDPMNSLTPHVRIGTQLAEVLMAHTGTAADEAWNQSSAMLARVGIAEADSRMRRYPFQFSGGERQRIAIAMSLMCAPALVIADEPTTALDVTVQAQILELLRAVRREFGMALALVSHDLAVVAALADRVLVMYAGRIVESAPLRALLSGPRHPYTAELLRCTPRLGAPLERRMATLPGSPPRPQDPEVGCAFESRCPRVQPRCRQERPLLERHGAALAACHFPLAP